MGKDTVAEQVFEYYRIWRELTSAYGEYAKAVGMSYGSLFALNVIFDNPKTCTQKLICEVTFLPKQTVNAIITGFLKQGLITLVESEADRRNKFIHLTRQGKKYAEGIIPSIGKAENDAMRRLDETQRSALLENAACYNRHFREYIRRNYENE